LDSPQNVVTKFLGNTADPHYVTIVANMPEKLKVLGCLMSLKIHFLKSHSDSFPKNLGAVSEEQGERFHQNVKEMERIDQGRWNINMVGDYCRRCIAKFRKPHITGTETYAASPARNDDSRRLLNKI
jgi:hypothetical protein